MSWGLGWKRPSEIFHLTLNYGTGDLPETLGRASTSSVLSREQELGFRIELEWSASEDEDQVALKLQSRLMVALPMPQDTVVVELRPEDGDESVDLEMNVVKRREPLRAVTVSKTVASGHQSDGTGVLVRLLRSNLASAATPPVAKGCGDHWRSVVVLRLSGCGLSVFPVELTQLPHLEKLYLDNNKLVVLPLELGKLRSLRVLRVDNNMLISVPVSDVWYFEQRN